MAFNPNTAIAHTGSGSVRPKDKYYDREKAKWTSKEGAENGDKEKRGKKHGTDNRLAYGLLIGAGISTNGLSPSQALDLVSQLHLMKRERYKLTEEDKESYKQKSENRRNSLLFDREHDIINSQSKEEAFQSAKQLFDGEVSFDNINNLTAIDDLLNTVKSLKKEYGLHLNNFIVKDLGFTAMASTNGKCLNFDKAALNNPNAMYRDSVESWKEDTQGEIDRLKNLADSLKGTKRGEQALKSLQEAQKKAEYKRHNVIIKGKEVESVTTHEMGHNIACQRFGQFNNSAKNVKKCNLVKQIYEDSIKNGDITKISYYARQDENEFFAECFTMYRYEKNKLPESIINMMNEVLKND